VSDAVLSQADAARADRALRSVWHWQPLLPPAARFALVPTALALVAALGLILALFQVVRGAVQQGDTRRQESAARVEATWRCKALRGLVLRENCLMQLEPPAYEAAPSLVSGAGG
jgi:hypothetical protein